MKTSSSSVVIKPFSTAPGVSIVCAGKESGSWTFYREGKDECRRKMGIVKELGASVVLLPDVSQYNGLIGDCSSFSRSSQNARKGVIVFDSAKVDGSIVREGEALAITSGDCPTIIIKSMDGNEFITAAHGGRDSVLKGNVVTNMVKAHGKKGQLAKTLQAFVCVGIAGGRFSHPSDHPVYGIANRKMLGDVEKSYGKQCVLDRVKGTISLAAIIEAQCLQAGMLPGSVLHDGNDTYGDLDDAGQFEWWSHRRFVDTGIGPDGRNLVLVVNGA